MLFKFDKIITYLRGLTQESEKKIVESDEIVKQALNHYCAICKTGFKTFSARNSHNAFKHKQNGNNRTPDQKLC